MRSLLQIKCNTVAPSTRGRLQPLYHTANTTSTLDAMSTPRCEACDSKLSTIEYQARAADEAQRRITVCSNCPLDASRLSISLTPREPHIHLPRFTRTSSSKGKCRSTNLTPLHYLHARMHSSYVPREVCVASCADLLDETGNLYRLYQEGPYGSMCISESSKSLVGPCVSHLVYSVAAVTSEVTSTYAHFQYCKHDSSNYMICYNGTDWYMTIRLESSCDEYIAHCMRALYTRHVVLNSLESFIHRSLLGSMSNLSARGYDSDTFPSADCSFLTKVDGERMWLTRIGRVWVFSRRLLSHSIVGWHVDDAPFDNLGTYGPTLDIEMLVGHQCVVIDILMLENGTPSPRNRTVHWIQRTLCHLARTFEYLSCLHTRKICSSYSGALAECVASSYPTDGVVAVPDGGVDVMKLKPIKSVELEATSNMTLCTSDRVALFRVSSLEKYVPGNIYEVGFVVVNDLVEIKHSFMRPDKQSANALAAVRSILSSSVKRDSSNIVRTALWRWSNEVRSKLYGYCFNTRPGNRLVLDVGTGDGQSSDEYIRSPECSFILVEPDPQRCAKLKHRLQLARYETDPRMLIKYTPSLKSGRMKYCIVNCTLQAVLEDNTIVSLLMPELKCVVACFSSQFIVECLEGISEHGVPFVGCCYVYDNIGVGGSIIDSNGITMKRIDNETASVAWGKDRVYTEPAIERHNLPHDVVIVNALTIASLEHSTEALVITKAASHLVVLYIP